MSDESTRELYDNAPLSGISRRWFLQGTVAAGAAALAFGQGKRPELRSDKPVIPDGPLVADCGCVNEAEIPLTAVAALGGKYFGFAGTESGPQIFSLNLEGGRISLGAALKTDLPEGFVFGSIGIARGGLIVTGGLPFVLETIEVDYELTEDVRAAMDNNIPDGIPTSGRQSVNIMGTEPAVFMINRPNTERLLLPDMPRRSFGVATVVTDTGRGEMALLIEHSDGVNESFYASAVDVAAEIGRDWSVWRAGRNLGESGPNFLVPSGESLIAGINTREGSFVIGEAQTAVRSTASQILALVPSEGTITALTKDPTGRAVWASTSGDGQLIAGPVAPMEDDELIGAVAVSGAKDQAVLLGRRSTVLVDNIPAFVSRSMGR